MRASQIRNVNVIAYASAVGRWIIRTEYVKVVSDAQACLDGDFDQVGCVRCRLTSAQLGIGPRDIKIAKNDVTQGVRATDVT